MTQLLGKKYKTRCNLIAVITEFKDNKMIGYLYDPEMGTESRYWTSWSTSGDCQNSDWSLMEQMKPEANY